MANSTDKSILTAAGKALLAQLNAEEKALVIDKMIFANVPNRPEYPQPDDVVPTDNIVHQEQVEQRGRLSADSVIYSTTLTSDVGPFDFNWTGAYCSEYGVLVTIDHHALTPKTADEPGVAGNTLVRSVVLEYKDIAEITNITVDASSWQYNATERMKKMDSDVAQSIIDQNGKDWFIEDGFLVTPSGSAYNIKAGAGYVSGNRVSMEFDRSVQVPNKPSFIYIDAHREGTPTGEQVTLFDFVITAEEKDDYIDSSTGKDIPHFVCKIAEVLADGSVSDLRPEGESATKSFVAKVAGLPWVQGENETKSTQKRTYIGPGAVPVSVVCPEASVANPVEMGEIPDTKWHVVSDKKSKIAAVGVTLTKGQRWVNVSGTDFPMSTPIASDKVVTAINITVKPFTITFPDETKFLLNPERFSPSKISILSYWADPKRKDNSDSFVQAFTDSGVLKQPIYIEGTGGYDNPYVIKQQVPYYGYGIRGDGLGSTAIKSDYIGVQILRKQKEDFGQIRDFYWRGMTRTAPGVTWMECEQGGSAGYFRTQICNVQVMHIFRAMTMEKSLFCKFDTFYIRDVHQGMFYKGGTGAWNKDWYNNVITYINCIFDNYVEYAVDFVGAGLAFEGVNCMQNGGSGLRIDRDTTNRSNNNVVSNIYFEFNTEMDMYFKNTRVTLGTCIHQSGPINTPAYNLLADNTQIYWIGRPSYLDNPAIRSHLKNGSKAVCLFDEIISNKITHDESSEYVYLPTRVMDQRRVQEVDEISSQPVDLLPVLGSSSRQADHKIDWIIEEPSGDFAMFSTYGRKSGGEYKIVVSGDAVKLDNYSFQVSIDENIFTFRIDSSSGSMTVESSVQVPGTTRISARAINSRVSPPVLS